MGATEAGEGFELLEAAAADILGHDAKTMLAIEHARDAEGPEPPQLPARLELGDDGLKVMPGLPGGVIRTARRSPSGEPAAHAHERIPLGELGRVGQDGPHRRGRCADADLGVDGPHAARSIATAVASPPPMHSDATPRLLAVLLQRVRAA